MQFKQMMRAIIDTHAVFCDRNSLCSIFLTFKKIIKKKKNLKKSKQLKNKFRVMENFLVHVEKDSRWKNVVGR